MNDKHQIQVELKTVHLLRWPSDSGIIASLTLEEKACWYAGQEPRYVVWLGNDPDFKRFWKAHYLRPLHFKRFIYKLKNALKTFWRTH